MSVAASLWALEGQGIAGLVGGGGTAVFMSSVVRLVMSSKLLSSLQATSAAAVSASMNSDAWTVPSESKS